jgi:serine protease AprX
MLIALFWYLALSMHIDGLNGTASGAKNGWHATVTVTVHTVFGPVSNATVTGTWSGGVTGSISCTTDKTGTCTVSSPQVNGKQASVSFTVAKVTHATSTYAPHANAAFATTILKP